MPQIKSTSGSLDRFRANTVNSTAVEVKSSAGELYGYNIINMISSTVYVKFYNIAAASVNPASSVPVKTLMVPGSGSVFMSPDCVLDEFTTAISVRAVTDSGDTGTTAPGTLPIIELQYA